MCNIFLSEVFNNSFTWFLKTYTAVVLYAKFNLTFFLTTFRRIVIVINSPIAAAVNVFRFIISHPMHKNNAHYNNQPNFEPLTNHSDDEWSSNSVLMPSLRFVCHNSYNNYYYYSMDGGRTKAFLILNVLHHCYCTRVK